MTDEGLDHLQRVLSVDCEWAAGELAEEARRARASELAERARAEKAEAENDRLRDEACSLKEDLNAELGLGLAEKARADKLEAFKAFVHRRLDTAGIPTHPNGPHSAEGCRIGDRLDIALAEKARADRAEADRDQLRAKVERLEGALVACRKQFQNVLDYGALHNPGWDGPKMEAAIRFIDAALAEEGR